MSEAKPMNIGDRLELFADTLLAEQLTGGATLRLHRPVAREVVLRTDRPWEGSMCGYLSIVQNEQRIFMYLKSLNSRLSTDAEGKDILSYPHPEYVAMVESTDGLHWTRPNVGRIEFEGSKANNLILEADESIGFRAHGFSAFLDTNPACPPDERYKGIAAKCYINDRSEGRLFGLTSPDGIHWQVIKEPILAEYPFDSQNLAMWDSVNDCYRLYIRNDHTYTYNGTEDWSRYVMTATSSDFRNWSVPEYIETPNAIPHHLYTSQVSAYPRAPHIFIGFPTRYVERGWCRGMDLLPEPNLRRRRSKVNLRVGTAVTESTIMFGRDGKRFHLWDEAFIRPGPQETRSWTYGDNYQGVGMVITPSAREDAPPELSFYSTESYMKLEETVIRRFSLRMDGFVSVNAPLKGGEVVTPPFIFSGDTLLLNIETSAAGSVYVQLETPDGTPIPGYSLAECHEIFGDRIEYPVAWQERENCCALAGQPVRMRVALHDADLYAFRFAASPTNQ